MELNFSALKTEDVDEVSRIEGESFSEPWSRKAFEDVIENASLSGFCLRNGDKLVGYCCWAESFDEAEITNVAVDEDKRGLGFGKILLDRSINELKKRKIKNVFLEVRESNLPAIRLYERAGFVRLGIRKNFYRFPTENALSMKLEIKESEI